MTPYQKKCYIIGGVMISLASGLIIGGALMIATERYYLPALLGIVASMYSAILYFSEGK